MPIYTVMHKKTGKEKDLMCSFDDLEKYLKENPNWSKVITAPNLVGHMGNVINQTSGDWKDLMKKMKTESGRGNNIKT